MHVAINGWFWNRLDTGSGQYVRRLVSTFAAQHPDLAITLIVPCGEAVDSPGPSVSVRLADLPGSGHRAKLRFEQRIFPAEAARAGASLIHVPYWGSPLRSPLPVVVAVHDLIPLLLPAYRGGVLARLYTGLAAAAARGAAAVITDSEASRQDILRRLHIPAGQVHAIPLAAGAEFQPGRDPQIDEAVRQKYRLPGQFVLYLGGYDIRKNVPTLLKAYTYIRDGAGDTFPLVLAGRPPDRRSGRFSAVEPLLDEMNIRDSVRITGWIDETDTPSLYRLAACFVFPSRYEGFGLPPLEAMACGTPVVAADASSLPEVVGDAGFLVQPDDARHMAGAILAILNQPELAADLRQRGLDQAAQFSWERTAARTLAVYKSIAG
jgi:glycosyltransferase involved in cell wall biosynthesis